MRQANLQISEDFVLYNWAHQGKHLYGAWEPPRSVPRVCHRATAQKQQPQVPSSPIACVYGTQYVQYKEYLNYKQQPDFMYV